MGQGWRRRPTTDWDVGSDFVPVTVAAQATDSGLIAATTPT